MIVFEQDPDVVRWGLHNLIHDCTLPNSGSCYAVTRHDRDTFNAGYVREYYNDPECANNVENDAVIARALQEELSRIADAEAFGLNNAEQESIIMQEWPCSHERYHGSEHKNSQEVTNDHCEDKTGADNHSKNVADDSSKDETAIPTSSSKSEEDSLNMEELAINSNLANEYAVDGEVGKRISDMVPIPLVPKTNGEIPSEDAETSDHQRLLDRLKVYDLVENKVPGDGNCQFRSLSDQLYRSPEHHKLVREQVIDQLKSQPQMYEGYVPMAYDDYLKKMSKGGEWGDHITLQAAADSYGVKIFVITSFKDTCYLEILPKVQKSDQGKIRLLELNYLSWNRRKRTGGRFEAGNFIDKPHKEMLLCYMESLFISFSFNGLDKVSAESKCHTATTSSLLATFVHITSFRFDRHSSILCIVS
ncbi:hypothetical protein POTOM_038873 [Populus tomentosa]|uniref:ubiquitinyl hydrolase 1 n=1 Tax=Populus tomentosa TaxID=118781 RepID=A0A8X7YY21_POPTO|nr:hypothetical protein POTOM_038873 [Populus tomentosa]